MATRKGDTWEAVERWRRRDPEATAAEMAREIGVSRERVRQILVAMGQPTGTRRSVRRAGKRGGGGKAQSRVITGGVSSVVSAPVAGTVGELLAAADLTARGYTVYAPIARHAAHADLIAVRKGREDEPISIEVRCGHVRKDGTLAYRRSQTRATHYAVVVTGRPVAYVPTLPD